MKNNFKNILIDRKVKRVNNVLSSILTTIKKIVLILFFTFLAFYIIFHIESLHKARLCEIFNDNPEAIINCYFNN